MGRDRPSRTRGRRKACRAGNRIPRDKRGKRKSAGRAPLRVTPRIKISRVSPVAATRRARMVRAVRARAEVILPRKTTGPGENKECREPDGSRVFLQV